MESDLLKVQIEGDSRSQSQCNGFCHDDRGNIVRDCPERKKVWRLFLRINKVNANACALCASMNKVLCGSVTSIRLYK